MDTPYPDIERRIIPVKTTGTGIERSAGHNIRQDAQPRKSLIYG